MSELRKVIIAVLQPYTIDDGTNYQHDSLVDGLEKEILKTFAKVLTDKQALKENTP